MPKRQDSESESKRAAPSPKDKYQSSEKRVPFKTRLGSQNEIRKQLNELENVLRIENQKQERMEQELKQKSRILLFKSLLPQYISTDKLSNIREDSQIDEDMIVPVDGDVPRGSTIYNQHCMSCHSLNATTSTDRQNGPALGLILNRRVGSDKQYPYYTNELLGKSFFWTRVNLYRFLFQPQSLLQETKCQVWKKPLASESDRADLIVFLKEFSQELGKNIKIRVIKQQGYEYYQSQLYAQKVRREQKKQ